MALKDIPVAAARRRVPPPTRVELVKNSFDVEDVVFHGLMAIGVLKEVGIKSSGAQHKRWSAFMQRTGRFGESPDYPAWTRGEFLEYAEIIVAMSDPAHPLYDYAVTGVAAIQEFSEQQLRDYEHLINVGASINRPPYEIIRI
ncbi:MAG: hypothetical protein O2845_05995 [Proteobacteria bacterium]|nr:hypothetical protein [Pseudomonadota bacterium]